MDIVLGNREHSFILSVMLHCASPGIAGKVGSGWDATRQMRRFKRKGRRILAEAVGLQDESRSSANILQA